MRPSRFKIKSGIVLVAVLAGDWARAIVFLPPKRDFESWELGINSHELSADQLMELPGQKSSQSSSSSQSRASSLRSDVSFSFNGIDLVSFNVRGGQRAEWETKLPPVEWTLPWKSGAWTGYSSLENELHHFYLRATRRGPEPMYEVYGLAKDVDVVDFQVCDTKTLLLLLRKKFLSDAVAPLTRDYKIVSAQESAQGLQRLAEWKFSLPSGQDLLSAEKPNACKQIKLNGWPKSYQINVGSI